MFESAELGHSIDKATYEREEPRLREALLNAQFDLAQTKRFPVIIVIGDHQPPAAVSVPKAVTGPAKVAVPPVRLTLAASPARTPVRVRVCTVAAVVPGDVTGLAEPERKARRDSWSALVILRDWIESGEPE